ncbi:MULTISPECIES: folylpolyglutamate synthase/dihydrofolate synthase family protein [unclassified Fibrobacter]|uniref:bifunctional folylpolyglutamate synthase/dihydrofolate synthase n=1 Tax=unclassified Fibrobacter TaxID=2634177 RepID=UPI000934F5FF|nr:MULTISPECIES: folylpolyglutamate synthase/dihydrofolate synthase family protein [unclassified Fibrobacter]
MQSPGMDYLNSRLMFGMVPGLESTRKLCNALGNPERSFKTIHIVGTNGKGSTSYYLAGILQAHGFKTGLFTSPHLVSLRERIRVNDIPISDADLDRLLLQVKAAAEQVQVEPTFFEVLTLVSFLYYAEQGVDVVSMEAGMGGRLDSTAVACGNIVVLTSIGLEHTEVLGPTESAILKEKMAIAEADSARGKTFIVGGLSESLLAEACAYASEHNAKCVVPTIRTDIKLPNLGHHYIENASLSLAAAESFVHSAGRVFDDSLALKTLETRSWAGRMQQLTDKNGVVRYILDGAHNSHAVRRLVETLAEYYPGTKFHCVFGALKDKDVGEMLKLMAPFVSHWHITKTPYPRFRELDDLRSELSNLGLKVASEGELSRKFLDQVAETASADNKNIPVLVTGSLYMIGETVQALKDDFDGLAFFRGLEPSTNEHR